MDDTILSAYGKPEAAWLQISGEFIPELAPFSAAEFTAAVLASGRRFWANADASWRLRLSEARRRVVAGAFESLHTKTDTAATDAVVTRIADRFSAWRDEQMQLFPGVHDAIDALKARGVLLALVTNGAAEPQRAKVERFALTNRFDHIQIEGEHGFGKPEEQAYLHAMQTLGVTAKDTWMIGDNLEWEVVAPQRLGIYAIWMDVHGEGLPPDSTVKPDRIIRSLNELLD
jgi:putative hydrolase of the HAD superfamily